MKGAGDLVRPVTKGKGINISFLQRLLFPHPPCLSWGGMNSAWGLEEDQGFVHTSFCYFDEFGFQKCKCVSFKCIRPQNLHFRSIYFPYYTKMSMCTMKRTYSFASMHPRLMKKKRFITTFKNRYWYILLSYGQLAVKWSIMSFHSAHANVCQQMQQMHNTHKAAICEAALWFTQSCRWCHSITKNRL